MVASSTHVSRGGSGGDSEPWRADSARNSVSSPFFAKFLKFRNRIVNTASDWASFHRYRSCDNESRAEKRFVPSRVQGTEFVIRYLKQAVDEHTSTVMVFKSRITLEGTRQNSEKRPIDALKNCIHGAHREQEQRSIAKNFSDIDGTLD